MTTIADVASAWALWKTHRDGCPNLSNAEPCECEDEDTWDKFECALDCYLLERADGTTGSCKCGSRVSVMRQEEERCGACGRIWEPNPPPEVRCGCQRIGPAMVVHRAGCEAWFGKEN